MRRTTPRDLAEFPALPGRMPVGHARTAPRRTSRPSRSSSKARGAVESAAKALPAKDPTSLAGGDRPPHATLHIRPSRPFARSAMASVMENRPVRSRLPVRLLRSEPHLYSMTCRSRLFYSRRVAGRQGRELFRAHADLFAATPEERRHSEELRSHGFTVWPGFVDASTVDLLYQKADDLFHQLHLDSADAYSVQNKQRPSLDGLSYEELEASEKMIAVKDPLLSIPEVLPIAFHERIFKIVVNFLHYVA